MFTDSRPLTDRTDVSSLVGKLSTAVFNSSYRLLSRLRSRFDSNLVQIFQHQLHAGQCPDHAIPIGEVNIRL